MYCNRCDIYCYSSGEGGAIVSAAAIINNGCMWDCLLAGLQVVAVWTGGWCTVCEFMGIVHRATIILIHRRA